MKLHNQIAIVGGIGISLFVAIAAFDRCDVNCHKRKFGAEFLRCGALVETYAIKEATWPAPGLDDTHLS
jgi:hypothetical protein